MLDYIFTASETCEDPPRGNVFLVISDLVAATSFIFAYIVFAIWKEKAALSHTDIGYLIFTVFGLYVSYWLWYAFRIPTRSLALSPGSEKFGKYEKYLRRNLVVILIQSAMAVLFGILYFFSTIDIWALYVIVAVTVVGLAIRVYFDCSYGPWD